MGAVHAESARVKSILSTSMLTHLFAISIVFVPNVFFFSTSCAAPHFNCKQNEPTEIHISAYHLPKLTDKIRRIRFSSAYSS